MLSPVCLTCRRRRIQCDGARPCSPCTARGLQCAGGYNATLSARGRPGDVPAGTANAQGDRTEVGTPTRMKAVHGSIRSSITRDPKPSLYREAQAIFDGLRYFNERISSDLISIDSHFNPYRVDLARIAAMPRLYVMLVVTSANVHLAMQNEANLGRPLEIVQREQDTFGFRMRVLSGLNNRLGKRETQASDATLMCLMCLLITTMQQSPYTEWRVHLEGLRKIIQMRGGMKMTLNKSPSFKPYLVAFMIVDVMAAITTHSAHKHMAEATLMALNYWAVEPNIFQSNLAISAPCPEDLFQCLILVNYLRSTTEKAKLESRRKAGTRMVLTKIRHFDVKVWANKMQGFKGWKATKDGVEFDAVPKQPSTEKADETGEPERTLHTPESMEITQKSSPLSEDHTNPKSPKTSETDLWLSVATNYQAAVLLYAIRTLIIDVPEDKDFLYEEEPSLDIAALRMETRETLINSLSAIFPDIKQVQQIGKLVLFPVFMCGMEIRHDENELQDFIVNGLLMLGQSLGTFGPICAIDELKFKWAADAAAPEGRHVTWNEYFQTRPDFIFGF
ncbi:fungal-specific transcription factor domain-containing protein [Xylariaceae sp. FL1651]|nr:fungal-specific transcription factor domain-containing protein [Xylariaceae sp. FL1651]